ncbi:C-8 acyltransferase [Pochonia chlamydosporia 170]|uniref:C-8 acyltransferase n=1 Tax=Pochonia chlamydosporia 170 TaxID=1380566 RepID=A0A179FVE0_METCM|nr:C-8 acyltransferase [Pochonia chlamydosporia 170]OAQ69043.1 C-8 acyltransferase [Pochonia chlamydosporia 170]
MVLVSDSDSDSDKLRLLSTWNQVAMRAYVRQVFCLKLNDKLDDFDELCTRIQGALSLACRRFPHFAGKICLGPEKGKVYLSTTPNDVVSFKFFDNRRDIDPLPFGWSYPELAAQGFPCKAFVGPWFGLSYDLTPDGPGAPVTEVHARVIRGGGLLLCVFIHHSISDGIGMCNFVSNFAAHTFQHASAAVVHGLVNGGAVNGDAVKVDLGYPTNIDVDIPEDKTAALVKKLSFEGLVKKCPEYTILPEPTGPTAPCNRQAWPTALGDVPKTGRIFKFNQDKIGMLKSLAQKWAKGNVIFANGVCPSTFACLAAVTWSFCTVARLESHQPQKSTTANNNHSNITNGTDKGKGLHVRSSTAMAHLLVPASWRRRAFEHGLDGYASNAVCMPRISASVDSHFAIGDDREETASASATCPKASPATTSTREEELGKLICMIDASIKAIDDKSVTMRTAMFRAAPDPRLVGVNIDPQDPLDFIVNSWRHLGGDIAFGLPGLEPGDEPGSRGRTADAVRRAQPAWNMGAGLVLPGKKRDSPYEILVTLDEESMGRLLANREWMKWVSETIE